MSKELDIYAEVQHTELENSLGKEGIQVGPISCSVVRLGYRYRDDRDGNSDHPTSSQT